jgi:hypothetical protein
MRDTASIQPEVSKKFNGAVWLKAACGENVKESAVRRVPALQHSAHTVSDREKCLVYDTKPS